MKTEKIPSEMFIKYQINESFDKPFNNIEKINNTKYVVNEDDVEAVFTFKVFFNTDLALEKYPINNNEIKVYYEVSWAWGYNMSDELKNVYNWIRMTSTTFKILDDFIRTMKPKVIKFSSQTEGNFKVYFNPNFIDKLETIFSEKFDVITDIKSERILLVDKSVHRLYEEKIIKLMENNTFEQASKLAKYPNKKNYKGIQRNDMVKQQQKRILYKLKYLFN